MPIGGVNKQPYQRLVPHLGTYTKGVEGEAEAFYEAEKLLLEHVGMNPLNVEDLHIYFRSQTATYTNPTTGQREEIDLRSISDERVIAALNKYYDIHPRAREDMKYARVYSHCKGNQSGSDTLQRTTEALQKLPQGISNVPRALAIQSSKEARVLVSKRMHFVEYFLGKWKEKIEERKATKQEELKVPTLSDTAAGKLRKELEELYILSDNLEKIDLYALSQALGFYPLGHVNQVTLEQIAKHLEEAVLSDIKPTKWRGLRSADHSPADIEYAKDVAGMLYRDRASYFKYCQKAFGRAKKENVSDIVLREAIQFAGMDGEYSAEGFKESVLLQGMSDGLRKELEDDLSEIGRLASHAMPEVDPSQFDEADFPENASDQDKAQLQMKKMDEAHKAYGEGINKDLKVEDLPPIPEEKAEEPGPVESRPVKPGLRSLAKKAIVHLVAGVATGGVLAAGALGWTSPVVEVARSFSQNPARTIASLALIDSLRGRVVDFVYPEVRDEETSIVSRKPNYRHIAYLSGAALMIALSGTLMYRAVNDGVEDDSIIEQAGEYSWLAVMFAAQTVDYVWQHGLKVTAALSVVPLAANLAGMVKLRSLAKWGGIAVLGSMAISKVYSGGFLDLPGSLSGWAMGMAAGAVNHVWQYKSSVLPIMAIYSGQMVSNRFPAIGHVTKPASRALGYVANARAFSSVVQGQVMPAIGWGIGKGAEIGGAALGMLAGAASRVGQFAKTAFETYKVLARQRAPLTIM